MSKSQTEGSDDRTQAEWGLTQSRQRSGGQTKIALLLIATLLGALSYFVYRKYDERGGTVIQAADFTPPQESGPGADSRPEENSRIAGPDLSGQSISERSGRADTDPRASGQAVELPVQQSEPELLDWFGQAASEPSPADAEVTEDESVNWPVAAETNPDVSAPEDDVPAFDLFDIQQEPRVSQTGESAESTALDPVGGAGAESVDPFLMTVEAGTTDPENEQEAPNPFVDLAREPVGDDADSEAWETEPAGPAVEPLEFAEQEAAAPWPAEPELIRVNSDDQWGEVSEQAAAFEDPFALEEDAIVEPPRDVPATNAEPLTLDFGIPASPAPPVDPTGSSDQATTAPPDETPSMAWPAPGAESAPGPAAFESRPSPPMPTELTNDPFTTAASAAPTNQYDDPVQVHTVRRGESYWSICRRYYGAGRYFSSLAAYNQSRIPDPNDLRPGMKVLVPEADVLERRFPALLRGSYVPGRAEPLPAGFFMSREGQPMYRVGRHDTLSGIAEAHLGRASRWRQIYGLNRDRLQNADRLQPGLELRLPADASQAALVPQSTSVR